MTADLKIGTQTLKFCGNAATAIRYKGVFHRDLLMSFKDMNENNFDTDIIKELAFIMVQQAQGTDFKQVGYDDYVAWLEQFEESDILPIAANIINLWMNNTQTMVAAKKK